MWGTNAKDEKVLIALALRAADNMVDLFVFPFEATSEEFYNLMLNEWRENHEVSFPEGFLHFERPLTAADSLLPEDLRVERGDIIQRAQTEWHFIVLSHKLYETFRQDLEAIREKIKSARQYSNQYWEEMKAAWEKVQKHIFDKTLMREHGQHLREMTNEMFTYLKNLRKEMDNEADKASQETAAQFNTRLDAIEEKIKKGAGLQPLFNDLKQLQQEFSKANLSRSDRNKLWKRIDHAFKAAKERKFGDAKAGRDSSAVDRVSRRLEGLMSAIDKMQKSIQRDEKDKHFQDDRIAHTEGQLEAQIRMAKMKMIEDRMTSKQEKLQEMLKTKEELEQRIEREKKVLDEQRRQQALKEQLKEAKESVKQKIAETIHQQNEQVDEEALRKAAEAIASQKATKGKRKESLLGAIGETLGESIVDLGDTLGAVSTVVAGKIGDTFRELKEDGGEMIEDLGKEAAVVGAKMKEFVGEVREDVKEKSEDIAEGAADTIKKVKAFARHVGEEVKEKTEDLGEEASDALKKGKAFARNVGEEVKEKAENIGESAAHAVEKAKAFARDVGEEVKEKTEDIGEGAAHAVEKAKAFVRKVGKEIDESLHELDEKMQQDRKTSEEDTTTEKQEPKPGE